MIEVRDAAAADKDSIATALISAFHDDPVMLHMVPKEASRPKKMGALCRSETNRSLKVGAVTVTSDGPAKGAAIWSAPGKWKLGGLELLGQFPLLVHLGLDTPRSLALLGQVEKVHPKEPHWYLNILGTATEHQGKGVGTALIAPILSKCDEEGTPAYLESSKESNIAFYNRYGFEVTGEVHIKNGPTVWPMWRDPRPPEL
jgi:GNAT superfamily N-acetyltransferase